MSGNEQKTVLITDSYFVYDEHEQQLKNAGFLFERLDEPKASEELLIEAIKGKSGYILGGVEIVTDKVIEAADKLEYIVFTGSDHRKFVPSEALATSKGIAIGNTPGANAKAVAETTIGFMILMMRDLLELGRPGVGTAQTTGSLVDAEIGIIGLGRIGERVVRTLKSMGAQHISYFNRTRREDKESELGITYKSMDALLSTSDVVSLHVSKDIGDGFFDAAKLSLMRDGAILIDVSFEAAINFDDLYTELESGRLRAAHDGTPDDRFKQLPLHAWFNTNVHNAHNTVEANKTVSDMATQSIINYLTTGTDSNIVNGVSKK